MNLIELQVGYDSDSEYFFSSNTDYLCLPAKLPSTGPIVAVLKSVHAHEDNVGNMKYHSPEITMLQAKAGAFTAAQRQQIQALLDELRRGPDTSVLTKFTTEVDKQCSVAELQRKYGKTQTGRELCRKIESLIHRTKEDAYLERQALQEKHTEEKEEQLIKLLRYPKAWQAL